MELASGLMRQLRKAKFASEIFELKKRPTQILSWPL